MKKTTQHSVSQRYDQSKDVHDGVFSKKTVKKMWKHSDDAIQRLVYLGELYDSVPKKLKNVSIKVLEFHEIQADAKTKKAVKKWLNSK